jgi:hypothetical protein
LKSISAGIEADDRYRTVPEEKIVDMLLVAAFVREIEAGKKAAAQTRIASAIQNWIRLGLGHRLSQTGIRLFDPVEVINRMKWAGYHDLDDFWLNHFVAATRAFFAEWNQSADGHLCREPLRFSVNLRRSFDLTGISVGQKLRLRLPLPLSSSSYNAHVEPFALANLSARVSRSEGRLDFQFDAPLQPEVEIGAQIDFSTDGHSKDDLTRHHSQTTRDVYLRASEGFVRLTPRLLALSKTLAGSERDQLRIATKFFHYIVDELMCGLVHYDQVNTEAPGDWVLEHGWYDCQLGSALFVSLCRAQGIPARILSGHVTYRLAPGFHYWAEVWIDERGWTPFDFLAWDLSEAGRNQSWRTSFVGSIDYRFVTQCFPLAFTGQMSIRLPQAWHLLNAPFGEGMEIRFTELNGKLIYCDRITCRPYSR